MDKQKTMIPTARIETHPNDLETYQQSIRADRWWASGPNNIENFEMFRKTFPFDDEADARVMWTKMQELHKLLLSIGGYETCFAYREPDIDRILDRGRFWDGKSSLRKGKDNACHYNVSDIFIKNMEKDIHICTGYALSDDGIWRQHSWLIHYYTSTSGNPSCRLIETTVKRVGYFGFEMDKDESKNFCETNF